MRSVLLAALTSWLAALAAAIGYLAVNNWFGAGDLYGMAVWSLPLALFVAIGVRLTSRRLSRLSPMPAYVLAFAAGIGPGLLTLVAAVAILGPWIGAFSFPVSSCWLFGGVIGFLASVWASRRETWPLFTFAVLIAVAVLARANAYSLAPPPQIRVYAKADATQAEVRRIWTHVIGQPHPSGQGHDLLDGLSSVSASGHEGPYPILTVAFRKSTSREERDTIIQRILLSPLVTRVETVEVTSGFGAR